MNSFDAACQKLSAAIRNCATTTAEEAKADLTAVCYKPSQVRCGLSRVRREVRNNAATLYSSGDPEGARAILQLAAEICG